MLLFFSLELILVLYVDTACSFLLTKISNDCIMWIDVLQFSKKLGINEEYRLLVPSMNPWSDTQLSFIKTEKKYFLIKLL